LKKSAAVWGVLFLFLFGSGYSLARENTVAMKETVSTLFASMDPLGFSRGPTGSELAWGESYLLTGMVAAYEATGDTLFLSRLCAHADTIFSIRDDFRGIRDDFRGRIMPAWSSSRYTNNRNHAWLVHAGMVTFPLARFVYLARREPTLREPFGMRAGHILNRLRETAVCFEDVWVDGPKPGEGYYRLETGENGPLPFNQQNALGRTFVHLWLATGDRFWHDKAEMLARYFRNRLRFTPDRNAWDWQYQGFPDGSGKGSEDISHAAINADFAFHCYRAGIVFTRKDMERFAGTVLRGFAAGDSLSVRVDGSGGYNPTFAHQAGRWLHLAYIEPKVADAIYRHLSREGIDKLSSGFITSALFAEVRSRKFRAERPVR
jgi:hypothetical protein